MNPIIIAVLASMCILFAVALVLLWEAKALRIRNHGQGRHRGRVPAMRWLRVWIVFVIGGCAAMGMAGASGYVVIGLAAIGIFCGLVITGEAEDHAARQRRR